jgi:hypothetical protein
MRRVDSKGVGESGAIPQLDANAPGFHFGAAVELETLSAGNVELSASPGWRAGVAVDLAFEHVDRST